MPLRTYATIVRRGTPIGRLLFCLSSCIATVHHRPPAPPSVPESDGGQRELFLAIERLHVHADHLLARIAQLERRHGFLAHDSPTPARRLLSARRGGCKSSGPKTADPDEVAPASEPRVDVVSGHDALPTPWCGRRPPRARMRIVGRLPRSVAPGTSVASEGPLTSRNVVIEWQIMPMKAALIGYRPYLLKVPQCATGRR